MCALTVSGFERPSIRRSVEPIVWTCISGLMAPYIFATALPTKTLEDQDSQWIIRKIESLGKESDFSSPQRVQMKKRSYDEVDSDDEGEADNTTASGASATQTPVPTQVRNGNVGGVFITNSGSAQLAKETGTVVMTQSPTDENREHWLIAIVSIISFIAFVAACWAIWRRRAIIAVKVFRRRRPRSSLLNDPNMYYKPEEVAPLSKTLSPTNTLFGGFGAPTVIGTASRSEAGLPAYPPPPALAPGSPTLIRANSARRQLVRDSLLNEGDRRRMGAPGTIPERAPLSITIPENGEYAAFVPPQIPDSPENARSNSRYSWVAEKTDSTEPARFRTINSWVGQQTERVHSRKAQYTRQESISGSQPPTPAAFRFHPGQEVNLTSKHGRMESNDLDMRLGLNYNRESRL